MAQWIRPCLLQGKMLFLLDANCSLLSCSKCVISHFVAYNCSEKYLKNVLCWEEEFMLIQVDCLQMLTCIILGQFPKDAVCLSLLFLWPALHVRAEWGSRINLCCHLRRKVLCLCPRLLAIVWHAETHGQGGEALCTAFPGPCPSYTLKSCR